MFKIQAKAGFPVPSEIVYLPEGEHTITPFVNGKAKSITVRVLPEEGESIAASFQASLEERKASNVRPWLDFEHKNGSAAGLPTAFRYEPGKGIMLSVDWTGAGKAALEGRDFSYLSPTFLLGDDGRPYGLPQKGPVAALVNEPAFRNIPRIAASDASGDEPETRIEAALAKAESQLAPHHGGNPDFRLVWEAAHDLDPEAFGEAPQVLATASKVRASDTEGRVQLALGLATAKLGEDADFREIWAHAAEIDPEAFQ